MQCDTRTNIGSLLLKLLFTNTQHRRGEIESDNVDARLSGRDENSSGTTSEFKNRSPRFPGEIDKRANIRPSPIGHNKIVQVCDDNIRIVHDQPLRDRVHPRLHSRSFLRSLRSLLFKSSFQMHFEQKGSRGLKVEQELLRDGSVRRLRKT